MIFQGNKNHKGLFLELKSATKFTLIEMADLISSRIFHGAS